MNRRGFLQAILAAGTAPAFVRYSSLMPLVVPRHIAASNAVEVPLEFLRLSNLYVMQSAHGNGSGDSWENAYGLDEAFARVKPGGSVHISNSYFAGEGNLVSISEPNRALWMDGVIFQQMPLKMNISKLKWTMK
jgi:hypothetical protein